MVHEKRSDIVHMTWNQMPEAVAVARKKFEQNPEANFSMWMSTLHSFHNHPKYGAECIKELVFHHQAIKERLMALTAHVENPDPHDPTQSKFKKWTECVDTLFIILEWLSHRPELSWVEQEEARYVVYKALPKALDHSPSLQGGHTKALLCLTRALIQLHYGENPRSAQYRIRHSGDGPHSIMLLIEDRDIQPYVYRSKARESARYYLEVAYEHARFIEDREQRSRVYREIAHIAPRARAPLLAIRALIWWLFTRRR